ncbi:class I SAM-dependent methyltransferase [Micromonospora sonneratiae]|uniref:Class I SAM-dependent methyltransferase n=1 Tax=Micromonospora sonneratiae TaxID=1184706 RepID=A0ABW3YMC8_9ACTN
MRKAEMGLPLLDRAEDADRYEVVSGGFDEQLFTAAAIGEHDRVLDIGCGYGRTTLLAARRAGRGRVVGNDVVEPMLAQARAFTAAEHVDNVTFETGDAQHHPFPTNAFDVAISRFGVMFFADPVAAFTNIGRALRPGGRLVFVTVGPPQRNDLPTVLAAAMSQPPAATGVLSLADPRRIDDVLSRAGYRDIRVTDAETTITLGPDAEAAAAFALRWGAFRDYFDRADAAVVESARAALTAAARPFQTDDGVRLRSTAWLVHATHP